MELVISQNAKDDLAKMLKYGTKHWGRERAIRFLDKFMEEIEVLKSHPKIGRKARTHRILPSGNYQILYQFDGNTILISAIEPKGRSQE